ncbi:hypothetical protein LIER_10176 [Lithospermum erythrorhizon]|uniref:Retrovirus-related Pol polyprotein from transposon TNT 1-94 n=1 Tax=Lithospermum erythrorhizon TaxID=34254 RepID=A0AAV3PI96_LITER
MIIALQARDKDLARDFVYAADAFLLWEKIKTQFGGGVGPRQYELRRAIYTTKQGNDYVVVLKGLREDLICLKSGMRYGDYEEEEIMLFLMGLNDDFESTRNQILFYDPLPNLAKAYVMISNVDK